MGVYDQIETNGRSGQVKAWGCHMRTVHQGDHVPSMHGFENYSVAMREGGYLQIRARILSGWQADPIPGHPVFDKYGRVFNEDTQGELASVMHDPYFFPPARPT